MKEEHHRIKPSDGTRMALPPRLVIAAPHGRSGKTTITIALGRALSERGMVVQPFKKGPDFIDPSWLSVACGRACRNLDAFMMGHEAVAASFAKASHDADVALIEGAMGLYDGIGPEGEGSTAHLARTLGAPVILVINTERMARSVAALVNGYRYFEPETDVAGIILNNVAGRRHEEKMREAIGLYCGIPVLGAVPKGRRPDIGERHLGLTPTIENARRDTLIEGIARRAGDNLDLDGIIGVAKRAADRRVPVPIHTATHESGCRIGVFRDKAFSFYYPENLEALREADAELVMIDAVAGDRLPAVDGLYLGGGFPELYLEELETNRPLREGVAAAVEQGLPVYAECGGLMYLCTAIEWHGRRYGMAGAIPAEGKLFPRPQAHGYAEIEVTGTNGFFPQGTIVRGHEFHHSRLTATGALRYALTVRRGQGIDGQHDGIVYKNLFASYLHLHAMGTPEWAENFVSLVQRYRDSRFKEHGSMMSGPAEQQQLHGRQAKSSRCAKCKSWRAEAC